MIFNNVFEYFDNLIIKYDIEDLIRIVGEFIYIVDLVVMVVDDMVYFYIIYDE